MRPSPANTCFLLITTMLMTSASQMLTSSDNRTLLEKLMESGRRTKHLRGVVAKLRLFALFKRNTTSNRYVTDSPDNDSVIPIDRKVSDYMEMAVYALLTVFGGAVNVYVGHKLWLQYRRRTRVLHVFDRKTSFLLLKLHLTLANLVILFVLCPSKLGWLVTYAWMGGETMCKVTSYIFMVGVNMPCYIITCIAVDRCRVVYKMCSSKKSNSRSLIDSNPMRWSRFLLLAAYIFALIPSTMQLLIWLLVTPEPEIHPHWHQCTTLWHQAYYAGHLTVDEVMTHRFYGIRMIDYQLWHLSMTFWIPFGIIVISYGYISFALHRYTQTDQCSIDKTELSLTPPTSKVQTTVRISLNNSGLMEENVEIDQAHDQAEIHVFESNTSVISNRHRPVLRTWHRQVRSKMFHTSGLVVSCYLTFWLPYATLALVAMYSPAVASFVDDNLYVVQSIIHFNTVVSPFLYGFNDK